MFLTFAVDPFADTITATLNKRATKEEYLKGNYYQCYTGKVKHRDLFDIAAGIDKLIASTTMCTDEVREEIGLMAVKYIMEQAALPDKQLQPGGRRGKANGSGSKRYQEGR